MARKIPDVLPDLKVGDFVSFRGHVLKIIEVKENGYIEAWSPTFHVTTDEPQRFVRVEDGK